MDEARCFDTIPSQPSLQACRNTVTPSASMCSLSAIPAVIGRQEVAGPRLALFERERPLISTRLFEGGDYFERDHESFVARDRDSVRPS